MYHINMEVTVTKREEEILEEEKIELVEDVSNTPEYLEILRRNKEIRESLGLNTDLGLTQN